MPTPDKPLFGAAELIELGRQADLSAPCERCGELACAGWESMPGSFDRSLLESVGTLRRHGPDDAEPTLAEYHPRGTHAWSADAPIAPRLHPYNRCDVWQCPACRRGYLRFTEYGGYYEDDRVRLVDPELVVDAPG